MNWTVVVLGVILLVVIYILYKVISEKGKVISDKVDLKVTNGKTTYETLSSPTSSRFSFSLWVYMEKLNSSGNTTIFKVTNGTATANNTFFELFSTTSPALKYTIASTIGNDSTASTETTNEIMPNFPLQKWVYVIVSVDNKIVDLYVDGKLVRSQQLDNAPAATDKPFEVVYEKCAECKGYVAKMERFPNPMDPETAWNKYMEGNGGNYFSKLLSSYGATFTLTKDDLDLKQFSLF